jgi:hypothetical protein
MLKLQLTAYNLFYDSLYTLNCLDAKLIKP